MSRNRRHEPTGKWWVDHPLALLLSVLVAHLCIGAVVGYYLLWVPKQADMGLTADGFWEADYWRWFLIEANLALLAQPWGVLVPVLVTKWVIDHRYRRVEGQ